MIAQLLAFAVIITLIFALNLIPVFAPPTSTLYVSGYFIVSQIAVMVALYAFTRIDWAVLFDEHRLRWR